MGKNNYASSMLIVPCANKCSSIDLAAVLFAVPRYGSMQCNTHGCQILHLFLISDCTSDLTLLYAVINMMKKSQFDHMVFMFCLPLYRMDFYSPSDH